MYRPGTKSITTLKIKIKNPFSSLSMSLMVSLGIVQVYVWLTSEPDGRTNTGGANVETANKAPWDTYLSLNVSLMGPTWKCWLGGSSHRWGETPSWGLDMGDRMLKENRLGGTKSGLGGWGWENKDKKCWMKLRGMNKVSGTIWGVVKT